MPTTLLCEGELQKYGWQFLGAGDNKVVLTPQGNFVAEKHGNFQFWPTRKCGEQMNNTEIHPNPSDDYPVTTEFTDQVKDSLDKMYAQTSQTYTEAYYNDKVCSCDQCIDCMYRIMRDADLDDSQRRFARNTT